LRIVVGVLMIILGFLSLGVLGMVVSAVATTRTVSYGTYEAVSVYAGLFLIALISGGGICALLKRGWRWAISGAIGIMFMGLAYMIFAPIVVPAGDPVANALVSATIGGFVALIGLLSVVFLRKRREEFRA